MSTITTKNTKFFIGLAMLAVFPLAYVLRPFILGTYLPICVFHSVTGHDCPFCGLSRAFSCATHGDFTEALHYHRFWWVFAAVLLLNGVFLVVEGILNREIFPAFNRLGLKWDRIVLPLLIVYVIWQFF